MNTSPTTNPSQTSVGKGILLKIASVFIFTLMATTVKMTAGQVPAGETVFFRSFFAIPVIAVWLVMRGDFPQGIKTGMPLDHFWRGLVGTAAMGLGFAALGLLNLADMIAIGYAAPLIATILAAMFLGERLRFFRLSAVAVGLTGVLVILYPNLTLLHEGPTTALAAIGALLALMGATFAGMAQVFIRKLVNTESTAAIVFWFSVTSSVIALFTIPFGWVVPNLETTLLLISVGLLGGIGQILLTASYRHAETAVIASFEYTSMVTALTIGYFVFGEVPTTTMLSGAGLIILAGLFIVYREQRLGIERKRARKVTTPQG